jgi:hypothetical protein
MLGLMLIWMAHATASKDHCMSMSQSDPVNVIVLSMYPMVRRTCSMMPLLLELLTMVATGLIP